jgi:hypothetical protein
VGCSWSFHLGLIFSGLVPNLVSRPLHMALALPWIFLFAAKAAGERGQRRGAAGSASAACLWIAWNHAALGDQYGFLESRLSDRCSPSCCCWWCWRRAAGHRLAAAAVALLALLYGLFGQHIPASSAMPARRWRASSAR